MATPVLEQLQPVKSSMFTHAGYDPDTFTLAVRYKPTRTEPDGPFWQYSPVGEELADDFFKAESMGEFFCQHIKANSIGEHIHFATPEAPGGPAKNAAKDTVDEDDLKIEALAIVDKVCGLAITTAEEYAGAAAELVRLRTQRRTAQDRVDAIKKPAYATYLATLKLEKDVIGPYTQAENYLHDGLAGYRAKEKAERDAAERLLNARRRAAAEAEAAARAQADRAADIQAAIVQGRPEVAAAIQQQPLAFVAPRVQHVVLPTAVPKVKGIIERAPVWKWRVKAGEEHLVPREYLQLNEVAINAAVTSQKGLTHIPGIEVWDEEAKVQVRNAR